MRSLLFLICTVPWLRCRDRTSQLGCVPATLLSLNGLALAAEQLCANTLPLVSPVAAAVTGLARRGCVPATLLSLYGLALAAEQLLADALPLVP